jgi:hypothetical protein
MNDVFNDAVSAALKLTAEESDRLVKMLVAMHSGVGASPARPARRAIKHGVKFGGNIMAVLREGPMALNDMVEPLRARKVILPSDHRAAAELILAAMKKSPGQYRQYPDGKWGLLSYTRLVS